MKPSYSLQRRIVLHFCTYFLILLTVYSVALVFGLLQAQDVAFDRQIRLTTEQILRHIEENGELPELLPSLMTVTDTYAEIPLPLRNVIPETTPGFLEINETGLDYHAAVAEVPSTGQMIYVLHNVGALEISERDEKLFLGVLLLIGLGVLAVGWTLAGAMSHQILRPIRSLADDVRRLSFDTDPPELNNHYASDDEIGVLAETIRQLLERIAHFTRREREFTAHASHELRTPATIIKGATELLREQEPASLAQVERIERAVTRIEELINTFLFLARQDDRLEAGSCDLGETVADVLRAHQHLLDHKPVEVSFHTEQAGTLPAPETLIWIAVANLVRNAFQYTLSGEVEIVAGDRQVTVSDTGPGTTESPGIGLTIVERLCERMHWRFSLDPNPQGGTRASLFFDAPESPAPM